METMSVKLLRDYVMRIDIDVKDLQLYLYTPHSDYLYGPDDPLNFIRWAVSGKKNRFFSFRRKRLVWDTDELYDFYAFSSKADGAIPHLEQQLSLMTKPVKGSWVKLKKLRDNFGLSFNTAFYEDAPRAVTLDDFVSFNTSWGMDLYLK
jgi:hypothetical protein